VQIPPSRHRPDGEREVGDDVEANVHVALLVPFPLPHQLVLEARTVGSHLVHVVPALREPAAGEGEAAGAKVALLLSQEVRAAGFVRGGDFFVGLETSKSMVQFLVVSGYGP